MMRGPVVADAGEENLPPRAGPFEFLQHLPAAAVARLLEGERPAVQALVLASLDLPQRRRVVRALGGSESLAGVATPPDYAPPVPPALAGAVASALRDRVQRMGER